MIGGSLQIELRSMPESIFLASPFDVRLSFPCGRPRSYAYLFLTPHVRVKFNAGGAFEPWPSFGGGYARFSAARPVSASSFQGGTNMARWSSAGELTQNGLSMS